MNSEFRISQSEEALTKYKEIRETLHKLNALDNKKPGMASIENRKNKWQELRKMVADYVSEITDISVIKESIESVGFNDQNGITVRYFDLKQNGVVELSINQQTLAELESKSDLIM